MDSFIATQFLLMLAMVLAPTGPAQQVQIRPNHGMSINFSLENSRVALPEPVILTFDLKNNTDGNIHVDLGRNQKANFLIAVTLPNGSKVQLQESGKGGFSRTGAIAVKPAESYSQVLLLNEWIDFIAIGRYEIEARLAKPIYADNDNPVAGDEVFRVELEVTPRNELALAKRCDALASQVEAFSSYESAAQAALALSHLTDPIAVPYLRRVLLAKKLVEPTAIDGLEKIASTGTVEALGMGLGIEYNDTSVLSRAALLRIESRTSDPTIKKEIIRILNSANKSSS